jgi:hypothetical protein
LASRECRPQLVRVHRVLAACVSNIEAVVSGQGTAVWRAPTASNAQYHNLSVWGMFYPFEVEIGETRLSPVSNNLGQPTFLSINVIDTDAKNLRGNSVRAFHNTKHNVSTGSIRKRRYISNKLLPIRIAYPNWTLLKVHVQVLSYIADEFLNILEANLS